MHAPNTEVCNNFKTVQQENPAIDDKLHDASAYVQRFRYEIALHLFNECIARPLVRTLDLPFRHIWAMIWSGPRRNIARTALC